MFSIINLQIRYYYFLSFQSIVYLCNKSYRVIRIVGYLTSTYEIITEYKGLF